MRAAIITAALLLAACANEPDFINATPQEVADFA